MKENLLDDFIENPKPYNATYLAEFIKSTLSRYEVFTGDDILVNITCEHSKSLYDLFKWCEENPQPQDKIEAALHLMIPGYDRARFMLLLK
jgi:hypothetical protein